ncbi:MAG: LytTR family DNA-binding domain-containing protein [Bacteroides sp.]|nr:LytTR family DNA-binding domain-containing protein [Bacteroides sp.]MCM1388941.1 LytTR family DNA-binding domain-containing protein [Bacteroides sp.]
MILRCCVVDDEPLARDLIAAYVDKTPFMELVGKFSSAQEAIKVILEEEMDVVFLDIHMPQLNGLEFARIIPPTCRIVFTTAYDRYAVDGYKVNALDYLMKPISYEEFVGAANRALEWADMRRRADEHSRDNRYLIVRSEYKQIQIPVNDIIFIEGLKDYVKIYVEGETNSIMSLMSIKALENYLPSSEFMRVHRSYIVNKSKIRVIERNRIVFGKHYIPVSDSYKQSFMEWVGSHSLFPPSGINN